VGRDLVLRPRVPIANSTRMASRWSSTRSSAKQLTPPALDPSSSVQCRGDTATDFGAPLHHYVTPLGRTSATMVPDHTKSEPLATGPLDPLSSGGKDAALQLPAVPHCFLCPIGQEIMSDPVTAADGVTYERAKIAAMLQAGQRTSPATGRLLQTLELHPNDCIREAIAGYLELRCSAERQWGQLEVRMSGFTRQIGRKLSEGEARICELQKDLAALQNRSGRGGRGSSNDLQKVTGTGAMETSRKVGGAAGLVSMPVLALPKPVVEEGDDKDEDLEQEGLSPKKPSPLAFSAGPAPRSARGPGGLSARSRGDASTQGPSFGSLSASASPPAARHNQTSSSSKSQYSSSLPSFFAAFSPRLQQMAKSPRVASRR